ncbi:CLIP-associating protein 1-like isoform X4 [Lineus longissimus]|uniref:CLIP-associating protein 1-like isoform X4 n=1 Tax=Lineus longissimus TaxID=88925 RepID=UPI00315D66F9
MATLDKFLPNVATSDTTKRMKVYDDLIAHLSDLDSSIECEEMDRFTEGLANWISGSNYKVTLNGLEVLVLLIDRMEDQFKHHVTTVLPAIVDRFGDSKPQVRDQALELAIKLLEIAPPQFVFDRLTNAFTHKLWKIREGVMLVLQTTLNQYGAKCLTIAKLVPMIVKCLDDQNAQVRQTAVDTLVVIYRHVGERVRSDLAKKKIPAAKLNVLYSRFDEVRAAGDMLVSSESSTKLDQDATDSKPASTKRLGSAPAKSMPKSMSSGRSSSSAAHQRKRTSSGAGAVDEEFFINQFEEVPKVMIFSGRELTEHMNKINTILSDPSHDWEKRVEQCKLVRSLIIAGAANYDEYQPLLRQQELAFVTSVKDLRSQIVRDVCISIAYLSQQLGSKFDHFAETVMPELIKLFPNTVKIMATSAIVCVRFLIQNTPSQRLIPIVTQNMSAKSSIIRRYCCEFLEQMLHMWPTHTLERHIAILQEAIKKGTGDADADARAFSRKAFWGFSSHFKEQADSLLGSLDPSKQRMLQGELSNSSSSNSLNSHQSGSLRAPASRARSASSQVDSGSLTRPKPQVSRRMSKPEESAYKYTPVRKNSTPAAIVRSSSDLDLTTTKKSLSSTRSTEGTYNSLHGGKSLSNARGKGNGVSSSSKTSPSAVKSSGYGSTERSRPRSRIGVSQSQPSSRSGSPSSRLSYVTYNNRVETPTSQKKRSAIPRSQGASRETSPTRISNRDRGATGGRLGYPQRISHNKNTTGEAPKRVLGTGRDSEQLLAQALLTTDRKRFDTYDSEDNASETSSICSERSYSSYGRASENLDYNSDRRKSHHSSVKGDDEKTLPKDVAEIVGNLASGSWADRKEGLLSLKKLLHSTRILNRLEVKKVTEIFTRMFHDPHGKVFGLFLEVLIEFIHVYRNDIQDWLYVLLTRLLNKLGADVLGSVQSKISRALDAVRECFHYDHQFSILSKYITDQTQAHNLKVKTGVLNYMYTLIMLMDPSDLVNNPEIRVAVSKIITWCAEPKSVEVRKAASAVIIALFDLNSPEFSIMLSSMPKTFQESATKIIHSHLKKAASSDPDVLSPRNFASPPGHTPSRFKPVTPRSNQLDEYETENMNPEEIYNSIRQTSADIQKLTQERDTTSQDSGISQISLPESRDGGDNNMSHRQDANHKQDMHKSIYNPSYYQDHDVQQCHTTFECHVDTLGDNDFKGDMVAEILSELSNHNERHAERKNAMMTLAKLTREGHLTTNNLWDEHFKSILLILLETLGDDDANVKALALRTLREILRNQGDRFRDYAELTILRVLEAHQDPAKSVVRAAEDCATTIANTIPSEQCLRVIQPIIKTSEFPISLAALKLENKVVDQMQREMLLRLLPDLTPDLIKACDHDESAMRKASVFCLVAAYMIVGEEMRPYLDDLTGSKLKLVNLYIKREQSKRQAGNSGSTVHSQIASPTSSEGML